METRFPTFTVEEFALTQTLEKLFLAAEQIPAEQVPHLLGELRKVEARLMQRLMQPPPAIVRPPDKLLTVEEAAERLGCSPGYLYNNHRKLPFSRKTDYGLRFSANALEEYCATGAKNISEMRTHNALSSSKIVRKTR